MKGISILYEEEDIDQSRGWQNTCIFIDSIRS